MATSETKRKLDEIQELLESKYITEEEFKAAKANVLREAGFDVNRRGEFSSTIQRQLPPRVQSKNEKKSGCGCGCFFLLLLLIAVIAGGIVAVPEDTLKKIPYLEKVLEMEQVKYARQEVKNAYDSFMGNTPEMNEAPQEKKSEVPPAAPQEEVKENKDMAVPETPAVSEPAAEEKPEEKAKEEVKSPEKNKEPEKKEPEKKAPEKKEPEKKENSEPVKQKTKSKPLN